MSWVSQLHDLNMWFHFKIMFDQITKCIEHKKKLRNFYMKIIYKLNALNEEKYFHNHHFKN